MITPNKSVTELSSSVEWKKKVIHTVISACIHLKTNRICESQLQLGWERHAVAFELIKLQITE